MKINLTKKKVSLVVAILLLLIGQRTEVGQQLTYYILGCTLPIMIDTPCVGMPE